MNIIRISLLSTLLLVSACSTSSKVASCPKTVLGQCLSMDAVNDLVDQGAFENKGKPQSRQIAALSFNEQGQVQDIAEIPLRRGEQVLPVWLAAYEDSHGNYVSAHTIFTIVAPSTWIPVPPLAPTLAEARILNNTAEA